MLRKTCAVGNFRSTEKQRLVCMLVFKYYEYGLEDYLQIEPQRPVLYVSQIKLYSLLHFIQGVGFTSPAIDLGQSSDTRFYLVSKHVTVDLFSVVLIMGNSVGSWPNQRHVSLQDINQLRQFV